MVLNEPSVCVTQSRSAHCRAALSKCVAVSEGNILFPRRFRFKNLRIVPEIYFSVSFQEIETHHPSRQRAGSSPFNIYTSRQVLRPSPAGAIRDSFVKPDMKYDMPGWRRFLFAKYRHRPASSHEFFRPCWTFRTIPCQPSWSGLCGQFGHAV
jgi:hypothetical protein